MKNVFLLCACFLLLLNCEKEPLAIEICLQKGNPSLIPDVQSLLLGEGSFTLSKSTEIHFQNNIERKDFFTSEISEIQDSLVSNAKVNHLNFKINKDVKGGLEAYKLDISSKSIEVSANSEIGLFWGIQTLKQLCYQYLDSSTLQVQIPELQIKDHPRFEHRGMLLDVCRHFFDKNIVTGLYYF